MTLSHDFAMFQTKEAERFLPSTTRMSRRNGFLATRLQMLHTSYEGTMSKGKTLCDGQKSTGWMQSNCWMSNSISLSLQNQLYQFLLDTIFSVRTWKWIGAILLQTARHLLWTLYRWTMRRCWQDLFAGWKMWLPCEITKLSRGDWSMLWAWYNIWNWLYSWNYVWHKL